MDEITLNKIIDRCLDDRSLEHYVQLAGRKATKTDTRAVAVAVIPYMVNQLDSKASKETRTAEKLHEYMLQAYDPLRCDDPQYSAAVVSLLLGSKKMEIIMTNADELLVHPFVVENMIRAFAPSVMRAYGAQFGKNIFWNLFHPSFEAAPAKPAPTQPASSSRKKEPSRIFASHTTEPRHPEPQHKSASQPTAKNSPHGKNGSGSKR